MPWSEMTSSALGGSEAVGETRGLTELSLQGGPVPVTLTQPTYLTIAVFSDYSKLNFCEIKKNEL